MATVYKTRRKCGAEDESAPSGAPGKGKDWHYVFEDQTVIDETAACPDHPGASVEFYAILETEET